MRLIPRKKPRLEPRASSPYTRPAGDSVPGVRLCARCTQEGMVGRHIQGCTLPGYSRSIVGRCTLPGYTPPRVYLCHTLGIPPRVYLCHTLGIPPVYTPVTPWVYLCIYTPVTPWVYPLLDPQTGTTRRVLYPEDHENRHNEARSIP